MFIRVWGFLKVPMIAWLRPNIIDMSDERVEVALPLTRRSRNHLNSMYFGALAAGADIAAGITAIAEIEKSEEKISFVFSSMKADFLKRAEGKTHFVCEEPKKVADLVNACKKSKVREYGTVKVTAYCPKKLGDEPVATFEMGMSVKVKA